MTELESLGITTLDDHQSETAGKESVVAMTESGEVVTLTIDEYTTSAQDQLL